MSQEAANIPLLETRISEVTVFNDRILVKREGKIAGADITQSANNTDNPFIITGLPLLMEDTTFRVHFDETTGVRTRDVVIEKSRIKDINAECSPLRGELEQLQRSIGLKTAQQVRQMYLIEQIKDWIGAELPGPPVKDSREQEPPPFPVDEYSSYIEFLTGRLKEEHRTLRTIEQELIELEREYQAKRDLLQAPEKYWETDPTKRWRKQAHIQITFSESRGEVQDLSFSVSYLITGARWAPSYTIDIDQKTRQATLSVYIRLAQLTNEDWHGVTMKFSATTVNRETQLPELPSRRIGRVQQPQHLSLKPPISPGHELFEAYEQWQAVTRKPRLELLHEKHPEFISRGEKLVGRGHRLLKNHFAISRSQQRADADERPQKEARPVATKPSQPKRKKGKQPPTPQAPIAVASGPSEDEILYDVLRDPSIMPT